MGKIVMSGGTSVDLDIITTKSSDILKDKISVDKDGEPVVGTIPDRSIIDETIGGYSQTYSTTPVHKGSNIGISNTTVSGEKIVTVIVPEGYFDGNARAGVDASNLGNATQSQVLPSATFSSENGIKKTGTMTTKSAATYYATTSDQTIAANQYLLAAQVIKAITQSNLAAGNVKTGVTIKINNGKADIWSVTGSFCGDATLAAAGNLLTGNIAYGKNGVKYTGTMANQGAKTASLNCGGSYTIPAGYHNGSGKITANSLASQTDANAVAANLLKDKTMWVKGVKITGTMTVQSVLSFSLGSASTYRINCVWYNPSKGPFSGVMIRYSTSGYPTSTTAGTLGYKGACSNTAASGYNTKYVTGLSDGSRYYFSIWGYAIINGAEVFSPTYLTANGWTDCDDCDCDCDDCDDCGDCICDNDCSCYSCDGCDDGGPGDR